jgi:hypothetical protein
MNMNRTLFDRVLPKALPIFDPYVLYSWYPITMSMTPTTRRMIPNIVLVIPNNDQYLLEQSGLIFVCIDADAPFVSLGQYEQSFF